MYARMPNLNFSIQSQHHAEFRGSVCRSDLSVARGLPLISVAHQRQLHWPGAAHLLRCPS